MKRSKRVTEGNLPTILSYVKKMVRNKHRIIFTQLKVKTLKEANRKVSCKTTIFKDFKLGHKVTIIRWVMYTGSTFNGPFIAVCTNDGSQAIVDIGDQVNITTNQIIIKKGINGEHGPVIEVWKFV